MPSPGQRPGRPKSISYQSGPVLLPPPTSWWLTCLNSQLIEKLITVRIATIAPRIARSASVGVRTRVDDIGRDQELEAEQEIIAEVMPQVFTFDENIPSAEARPFKTQEAQNAEKNAPQNHSQADHTDHQTEVLNDFMHR